MSSKKSHKWTFSTRFRRRGFGWKGTAPAKQRLKEALAEIKQVTRHDPVLGAEGAVLLLEKISPALEQIDSSSGAIGTAVYNTIEALAPLAGGSGRRYSLYRTIGRLLGRALRHPGMRFALGR